MNLREGKGRLIHFSVMLLFPGSRINCLKGGLRRSKELLLSETPDLDYHFSVLWNMEVP